MKITMEASTLTEHYKSHIVFLAQFGCLTKAKELSLPYYLWHILLLADRWDKYIEDIFNSNLTRA